MATAVAPAAQALNPGALVLESRIAADAALCLAWLLANEDAWDIDDEPVVQPTRGGVATR